MSLGAFQQVMGYLIIDADFAEQVQSHPEEALAPYDLDPREQRRLSQIARDSGVVVGRRIHRFFRINAILESMPLTVRLLGAHHLRAQASGFWEQSVPRNYYYHREAHHFGRYLIEQVESGNFADPYLVEIVRYELAVLDLTATMQTESPSREDNDSSPNPKLQVCYRLVTFGHSPAALLDCLQREQVPQDLPEGRFDLLLDGSSGVEVRLVPLLPQLGAVLQLCDGSRTVQELATRGVSETMIQRLAEAGYLVR